MSASESDSSPQTSTESAQTTVQGAAGANSPTLTAGADISYNDPALQEAAINAVTTVVNQVLNQAGGTTGQAISLLGDFQANQAEQGAAAASNSNELLSQVLAADNSLAQYQGSGGMLNTQTSNTTNYLIFGAIGVAALAVLALLFGKR